MLTCAHLCAAAAVIQVEDESTGAVDIIVKKEEADGAAEAPLQGGVALAVEDAAMDAEGAETVELADGEETVAAANGDLTPEMILSMMDR